MMKFQKPLLSLFLLIFIPISTIHSQTSISEKTDGLEKYEGFFNFWWDNENGKIWLEIDKLDQEFIYVNSLAAGVGSNDIGLDRSQLGNTRIVKFTRIGPKVLMVQPNYSFRATSGVPIYLFHRYQTEATVKLVGGVDYAYNLRGDDWSVSKRSVRF